MERPALRFLAHVGAIFVMAMVASAPVGAEVVSANSVLIADETLMRPHQIFSDEELRFWNIPVSDTNAYWVVNAANVCEVLLDDYAFWGLLYNDFYRLYHSAKIPVATASQKRAFEQSKLYREMKYEMDDTRDILISDTIHMPLRHFVSYGREYDASRGGFMVREELDAALPPILANGANPSAQSNGGQKLGYPDYFVIPQSLKKKLVSASGKNISFFMPIADKRIAAQIENMNRPYDKNFDLLLQFRYVQKPKPYVELVDIILLSNKDNRILWTLKRGDLTK